MKTFKHVSNTWLLAQFFHPFIFMIGAVGYSGQKVECEIFFPLVFAGFFFSLPGYFLCLIFFNSIADMHAIIQVRLLAWIAAAVACVVVGFLFICSIFFEVRLFIEEFILVIPGCIAAIVSILCRYHAFARFSIAPIE